nr:hypothetical protein CFP56_04223 [Quercus suber]
MTFWGGGKRGVGLSGSGQHKFLNEIPENLPRSQKRDVSRESLHGHGVSRAQHKLPADVVYNHGDDDSSDESQAEEAGVMVDDAAHTPAGKSSKRKTKYNTTSEFLEKKRKIDEATATRITDQIGVSKQRKLEKHKTARSSKKSKKISQAQDQKSTTREDVGIEANDGTPEREYEGEERELQCRPSGNSAHDISCNEEPRDQELCLTSRSAPRHEATTASERKLEPTRIWLNKYIGVQIGNSLALQDVLMVYRELCPSDVTMTSDRIRHELMIAFPELNITGAEQLLHGYYWQIPIITELVRPIMRIWIEKDVASNPQVLESFPNLKALRACRASSDPALADVMTLHVFNQVMVEVFPHSRGYNGLELKSALQEPTMSSKISLPMNGHVEEVDSWVDNSMEDNHHIRAGDLRSWFGSHYVHTLYATAPTNLISIVQHAETHFGQKYPRPLLARAIRQLFSEPPVGFSTPHLARVVDRKTLAETQLLIERGSLCQWLQAHVTCVHNSKLSPVALLQVYADTFGPGDAPSKFVLEVALKRTFPELEQQTWHKGMFFGIRLITAPTSTRESDPEKFTRLRDWVHANLLPDPNSSIHLLEVASVYQVAHGDDSVSVRMIRVALGVAFPEHIIGNSMQLQGFRPETTAGSQWSRQMVQLQRLMSHGKYDATSTQPTDKKRFLKAYKASNPDDPVTSVTFSLDLWQAFPNKKVKSSYSNHTGLEYVEDFNVSSVTSAQESFVRTDVNGVEPLTIQWICANLAYDPDYALDMKQIFHVYETTSDGQKIAMDKFRSVVKTYFPGIYMSNSAYIKGLKHNSSSPSKANWKLASHGAYEAEFGNAIQSGSIARMHDQALRSEHQPDDNNITNPAPLESENVGQPEVENPTDMGHVSRTQDSLIASAVQKSTVNTTSQNSNAPNFNDVRPMQSSQVVRPAVVTPTAANKHELRTSIKQEKQEKPASLHVGAQWFREYIEYDDRARLEVEEAHNAHTSACLNSQKQPYARPVFSRALARIFPEVQVMQNASHVVGLKFISQKPSPAAEDDNAVIAAQNDDQESAPASFDQEMRSVKPEPVPSPESATALETQAAALMTTTTSTLTCDVSASEVSSAGLVPTAPANSSEVKIAVGHLILDSPDHLLYYHHLDTAIAACPSISTNLQGLNGLIDLVQAQARDFGVTRDLSQLNKMLRGVWLQRHVLQLAKEVQSSEAFVQVAASILQSGTQHHGSGFVEQVLARVKNSSDGEDPTSS